MAPVAHLGPVWHHGRRGCLRGRRGTWRHRLSLCVEGWHLVTSTFTLRGRRGTYGTGMHWTGSGGALRHRLWHLVTSTVILRGRRGTYGSGGALGPRLAPWSPRLFAWQAWHLATSTFTLRGRVALGDIHRHFAWQAWHLPRTSTSADQRISASADQRISGSADQRSADQRTSGPADQRISGSDSPTISQKRGILGGEAWVHVS